MYLRQEDECHFTYETTSQDFVVTEIVNPVSLQFVYVFSIISLCFGLDLIEHNEQPGYNKLPSKSELSDVTSNIPICHRTSKK